MGEGFRLKRPFFLSFERHWFIGGNKGSAYVDGFGPEGKIVRTAGLLQNVGGKRTMTAEHILHAHQTRAEMDSLMYKLLDCLIENYQLGQGQIEANASDSDLRMRQMMQYIIKNIHDDIGHALHGRRVPPDQSGRL